MKFETMQYADIGTPYLAETDLDLISSKDCPGHLFEHDDGLASIIHITDDKKLFSGSVTGWKAFGLSDRFVQRS